MTRGAVEPRRRGRRPRRPEPASLDPFRQPPCGRRRLPPPPEGEARAGGASGGRPKAAPAGRRRAALRFLFLVIPRGAWYTLPASKSDRDAGGRRLDLLNRGIRVKCGAPPALRIIPARGRHCEAETAAAARRERSFAPDRASGVETPFPEAAGAASPPLRTSRTRIPSGRTSPDSEFYEPAVSYKEPRNPVKVRRGLALPCPPSLFPCAISDGA